MVRKGDTLIEVTLAVGIFSMIAIAVVSVMSAGTSNAQTALETTLAREEIDVQAETLRFIHTAYTNHGEADNTQFVKIWDEIVENANDPSMSITQYYPDTCSELYTGDNNIAKQNAFVLNPNKLDSDDGLVKAKSDASLNPTFRQAQTFPRIIYKEADASSLISAESGKISRVEGIYIVPVKDKQTTIICNNKNCKSESAFYDFYIRTCWYGSNADRPSSISTLIRLYNPKVFK
ncbi:hypothetical protein IKF34_01930 [Candidatus Saccharibacteria bacterium]|nr:hypothetical protein [Candidatus Saccharibacteria bacterium]